MVVTPRAESAHDVYLCYITLSGAPRWRALCHSQAGGMPALSGLRSTYHSVAADLARGSSQLTRTQPGGRIPARAPPLACTGCAP